MTKIINCTPHPITLVISELRCKHCGGSPSTDRDVCDCGGEYEIKEDEINLPKGEVVPRISQSTHKVDEVNGIPITETVFGETQDLPEAKDGTLLIVSRLILSANPNRKDLVVPNELLRDESGNIIGCKSLARN